MPARRPSTSPQKKANLGKKLQKMLATPAGFAFYVAVHDFVEVIEVNADLSRQLSKDLKYGHLKQIHRGIKDVSVRSQEDLGHERYMVLNDLRRIQNEERSDGNSLWKKRELFRKLALEIYGRLEPPASAKK